MFSEQVNQKATYYKKRDWRMMAYTFVRQSRFKSNLSDRLRRPALLLGEPFIKRQTSYIKLSFPSGLDGGDEFLSRIRDFIGRLAATG